LKQLETKLRQNQFPKVLDFATEVRKLMVSGYSQDNLDGAGFAAVTNLQKRFEDSIRDIDPQLPLFA
jgi:hypothetical protein